MPLPQSGQRVVCQPLRHILVPTDFSAHARRALEWAMHLAHEHGATISLIHAVDPAHLAETDRIDKNELQRSLDEVAQFARERKLEAVIDHEVGRPWEVIARKAAELNADLVVIGTSGRGTLGQKLMGGTADRVIRISPAPVLVVHLDDVATDRGFRRVLVAVDFSSASIRAAQAACTLLHPTAKSPAKMLLLHVTELELPDPGTYGMSFDPHYWENKERDARAELEKLAATLRSPTMTVETQVARGFVARVILDAANSMGADLIATGTHGYSGISRFLLGSVADNLLKHAKCPVLTTRATSEG